jgi:hypothetical protein
MFKRNDFLTAANTIDYDSIAKFYMNTQSNLQWKEALKSATESLDVELGSWSLHIMI